ncbi:MAG: hypothetical protein ACI8QD_000094 [Cyclobacteriaceae bacterium]|jgi:hypothetical protein
MKVLFLVSVSSLCLFVSCLNTVDEACSSRIELDRQEFYIFEDENGQFLSQSDEEVAEFLLCEVLTIPDTVQGFNNIYAINGTLIDECEEGADCVRVNEVLNPFCEPSYTKEVGNFSFFGQWILAYQFNQSIKYYPSCSFPSITLLFSDVEETGDIALSGSLGINDLNVTMGAVSQRELTIKEVRYGTVETVPYAFFFETQLKDFFDNQESIGYVVDGNELTINSLNSDRGLVFYKP